MLRDSRPRPPKPPRALPKPGTVTLEMYREPIFRLHRLKLEAFIEQVFGFDFDVLVALLIVEGETVEFDVTGTLSTNELARRAGDLRIGKRTRDLAMILNVLAFDGYIPKGRYTVVTRAPIDPLVQYRSLLQRHGDPKHPACVSLMGANRGNHDFMSKAAMLDEATYEARQ